MRGESQSHRVGVPYLDGADRCVHRGNYSKDYQQIIGEPLRPGFSASLEVKHCRIDEAQRDAASDLRNDEGLPEKNRRTSRSFRRS